MRYKIRKITPEELSKIFLSGKRVTVRTKDVNGNFKYFKAKLRADTYGGFNFDRREHENSFLSSNLDFPELYRTQFWSLEEEINKPVRLFYGVYKDFLNDRVDLIYRKKRLKIKNPEEEIDKLNNFDIKRKERV